MKQHPMPTSMPIAMSRADKNLESSAAPRAQTADHQGQNSTMTQHTAPMRMQKVMLRAKSLAMASKIPESSTAPRAPAANQEQRQAPRQN